MLLDFRERIRSSKPLKYSLITLISIPFVLVGIGSYFSGGSAEPVAVVNGEEITPQQLDQAYSRQRQQFAQLFGGEIPEGFANEAGLRREALNQLIERQLVAGSAEAARFTVSDATLGREIRSLPIFQEDGRFDMELYRTQLRTSGLSVGAFEEQFRADAALDQFQRGVSATSFVLPEETARRMALEGQRRTIDYLRYSLAEARALETVTSTEAEAWFDENADEFRYPERVRLAYIELDAAALADEIEIDEAQARAFYEDNRASYMQPEVRSASHILLEVGDDAEEAELEAQLADARTRIESGESFESVAESMSDDVGSASSGGSLGPIERGVMDDAFEDALYALENVGDLSEPVRSDFGYHLIRLDEIREEAGEPFDAVREQIVSQLQQNEVDREFFELRELLTETAFDSPDSLEAAADATGLEIQTSEWVDRDTADGSVVAQPAVLQAALSDLVLADGNNSDPIEVGDRHLVVVRVLEHQEPRPQAFSDVEETVIERLERERAATALDELVATDRDGFGAVDDVASLATDSVIATAEIGREFTRDDESLDPNVVSQIFATPKPRKEDGIGTPFPVGESTLGNGDRILFRVTEVSAAADDREPADGDAAVAEGDTDAPATPEAETVRPSPIIGNVEFQALVDALRDSADVDVIAN